MSDGIKYGTVRRSTLCGGLWEVRMVRVRNPSPIGPWIVGSLFKFLKTKRVPVGGTHWLGRWRYYKTMEEAHDSYNEVCAILEETLAPEEQ